MRDGGQHLFGGAGDGRDHHDGERDAAGERGEVLLLHHDERVDGDAHHDGGNAVEHVCGEADGVAERLAAAKLREIDAGGDADRNAHEAGEREDDAGADDGVRHAAARPRRPERGCG